MKRITPDSGPFGSSLASASALSSASAWPAAPATRCSAPIWRPTGQGSIEPVSTEPRPLGFVIQPGQPTRTIAENLANAGLITDARLFEAYVRVNGLANLLQAGAYQLRPEHDHPGDRPDLAACGGPGDHRAGGGGLARLEQIADYLTQKTPLDGADYRRRAEAGDLAGMDASRYDFLAERPAGASLEGYLYPDSYRLPAEGATAADLLGRQLDKFAEQVMPFWREAKAKGSRSHPASGADAGELSSARRSPTTSGR